MKYKTTMCKFNIYFRIYRPDIRERTSLAAQTVKNLPANAGDTRDDIRVQSLVWEDPLEKGMVTHSNILLGENSMDRGA